MDLMAALTKLDSDTVNDMSLDRYCNLEVVLLTARTQNTVHPRVNLRNEASLKPSKPSCGVIMSHVLTSAHECILGSTTFPQGPAAVGASDTVGGIAMSKTHIAITPHLCVYKQSNAHNQAPPHPPYSRTVPKVQFLPL